MTHQGAYDPDTTATEDEATDDVMGNLAAIMGHVRQIHMVLGRMEERCGKLEEQVQDLAQLIALKRMVGLWHERVATTDDPDVDQILRNVYRKLATMVADSERLRIPLRGGVLQPSAMVWRMLRED